MRPAPILPAGKLHAAAMARIAAADLDPTWNAQAFAGVLSDGATIALVALDDAGEPIGFSLARIAADEAELLLIAVALPARRQSIARRLLDATIAEATRRTAASMFLEVDENNAAAINLYATAGFAQVGRRKGYYRRGNAKPTDALLLARRLDCA
jgi:ribosomal-protein-alanine N-acetyltransferase